MKKIGEWFYTDTHKGHMNGWKAQLQCKKLTTLGIPSVYECVGYRPGQMDKTVAL